MKKLKIKEDMAKLILTGEKRYEFRKLAKGIVKGYYEFVSINQYVAECECGLKTTKDIKGVLGLYTCQKCGWYVDWINPYPTKKYFTAYLKPLSVENKFLENIDFIKYKIEDVKEINENI